MRTWKYWKQYFILFKDRSWSQKHELKSRKYVCCLQEDESPLWGGGGLGVRYHRGMNTKEALTPSRALLSVDLKQMEQNIQYG